ncbi:MAG: adenosine deaminase [Candidatus Kuenenia sp.]|nr:adenosine deaminase [Candidatus Kuenenia hertensis]
MNEFICNMPKAELHVHIEGTLEPELMFTVAERNKISLPYKSVEEASKAYNFKNLQSFLDIYYRSTHVLLKEQDFYEITWNYLKKASSQNIRHTEMFFDPQAHTSRGIQFETVFMGILNAMKEGAKNLGISSKLIMCFQRCMSVESAMETLLLSLPYKEWIIGVGLDSSEAGYPPRIFASVFDRARKEGFLTVAHAGEEGPPEYIWQALNELKVVRVDHGIACVKDLQLVHKMKTEKIPLTICPLSNVKLHIFDSLADHNLKQLLDMGLQITINSDDPAYFGGYLNENFLAIQDILHLNHNDIYQLAKNSFQATFLTAKEKAKLLKELDNFTLKQKHTITEKIS